MFGIVGLVLLLVQAVDLNASATAITSYSLYGGSMILLFLASTLYHAIPHQRAKMWLKKFDHCAIYLLIAGTYTPFLLVGLDSPLARGLMIVIWSLALNIEAGFPVIDAANSGQFIPQATNLQALGGISFKKGCYTGQEMVARAKFRGANKRALWLLTGSASRLPEAGEDLELKMGENWRRTGTVLAAVKLEDGQVVVQVVMNNDMEPDSIFRVRDDANTLHIEPLPYSLEE